MFGARPLGRVIQKEVRDVLTDQILFGALEHGGTVTIDVADNHLTFAYASPHEARVDAPVRRSFNEGGRSFATEST